MFDKKKYVQFYKYLCIQVFKIIYGKIKKTINIKSVKKNIIKKILFEHKISYNFYNIPNGRLYTTSVHDTAFIQNNNLIIEPTYQFRIDKNDRVINGKINQNTVILNGTPKLIKKINGSVYSLLSGGGAKNNYWHWIFDVVPKIAILEKAKLKKEPNYFLLPSLSRNFQKETFLCLGIPYKKLLNGEKFKHIICDNLLASDHPIVFDNNPTKSISNIPIWVIKWLRKKFVTTKSINTKLHKKIFIDRENDSNNQNRKIINNEEVKKLLTKSGFKYLILSNYSFKKQVEIFKAADFIIGLHGAGFTNIVFSKPKTRVLEIKTKTTGSHYSRLAKKCKLKYQEMLEENISSTLKHQNSHIVVNISKLKKMIR